jgi:nitrogen fixation protein FixH
MTLKNFNWGYGIALVYGGFVAGMLIMIFAMRKHNAVLTQKDYYKLDLEYQQRLESKQNMANLGQLPQVRVDKKNGNVVINLPSAMSEAQGKVKFFRSANADTDVELTFQGDSLILADIDKRPSGNWQLELDWTQGGKPYFYETAVFIP